MLPSDPLKILAHLILAQQFQFKKVNKIKNILCAIFHKILLHFNACSNLFTKSILDDKCLGNKSTMFKAEYFNGEGFSLKTVT